MPRRLLTVRERSLPLLAAASSYRKPSVAVETVQIGHQLASAVLTATGHGGRQSYLTHSPCGRFAPVVAAIPPRQVIVIQVEEQVTESVALRIVGVEAPLLVDRMTGGPAGEGGTVAESDPLPSWSQWRAIEASVSDDAFDASIHRSPFTEPPVAQITQRGRVNDWIQGSGKGERRYSGDLPIVARMQEHVALASNVLRLRALCDQRGKGVNEVRLRRVRCPDRLACHRSCPWRRRG